MNLNSKNLTIITVKIRSFFLIKDCKKAIFVTDKKIPSNVKAFEWFNKTSENLI